ncbi:MAG: hypothetical protein FWD17_00380 [Polyangiaceae bacterium]|nr:hypothetical protein [Polyangiaceae bacterium]
MFPPPTLPRSLSASRFAGAAATAGTALVIVACGLPLQGEELVCSPPGSACVINTGAPSVDAAPAVDARSGAMADGGDAGAPTDASQGEPDVSLVDAPAGGDGAPVDAVDGETLDADQGAADAADGETSDAADAADVGAAESGNIDATEGGAVDADGAPDNGMDAAGDVAFDAPDTSSPYDDASDGTAPPDSTLTCNALDNSLAPVILELDMAGPGATGQGMGGSFAGGTYVLTSYTVYGSGGSGGGGSLQVTISLTPGAQTQSGVVVDSIENANGAGDVTYGHDWQVLFGSTVRSTSTCGPAGSIFDTTGTETIG